VPFVLLSRFLQYTVSMITRKSLSSPQNPSKHTNNNDNNSASAKPKIIITLAFRMVIIVSVDQMLVQGLRLVGFNLQRVQNVSQKENLARFRAHYGSNPIVYTKIWEDLQVTPCHDALVDCKHADLALFLMAIHFLKCYPTEAQLAATFRVCERSVRKWCRYYACKIQALKEVKVSSATVMQSEQW
jgi:hypothetical protein